MKRYVAHFDMLGMSALVKSDFDHAWRILRDLSEDRRDILRMKIRKTDTDEIVADKLNQYTFSDTIIVHTTSDDQSELEATLILCTELFCLALSHCIPMRVGIACGQFRDEPNENLFAGPALVDAYELGEHSQWLGICLCPEVASRGRDLLLRTQRQEEIIVKWHVPQKNGNAVVRDVISWPLSHKENFKIQGRLSVEQFFQTFKSLFGDFESMPRAAKAIYENTVAFVNAQRAEA